MRKAAKKLLLELTETLYEAHENVKEYLLKDENEKAASLLGDCQDTAISIGENIQRSEGEEFVTVEYIEVYCMSLFNIYNNIDSGVSANEAYDELNSRLDDIKKSIENDIKVKLEIVFFPYKTSMWDSFESIWKAADEDPNCDAYVVPIPYYDRNPNHSFGKFHYEGKEYPDYVPVTHYNRYDVKKRKPDVIYIHNPYDDCNYVTSVDPRFYSYELKKYTECLVYVPYAVYGCFFLGFEAAANYIFSAFKYVDYIITQSKNQSELYKVGGVSANKLKALGSPKIDCVANGLDNVKIPEKWYTKTKGRKIIFINTSIAKILNESCWINYIEEIIALIENNPDILFIWRPHPLLRATVISMLPAQAEAFDQHFSYIRSMSNAIIDNEPDTYPAIKISDGLISDYSSVALQFSVTGKPVILSDDGGIKEKNNGVINFNYLSFYFFGKDMNYQQFVDMIRNNDDKMKIKRMNNIFSSMENMDGTCGIKTHKNIIEIISKENKKSKI